MPLHANWHNSSLYVWGDAGGAAQPMHAEALRAAVSDLAQDALLVSVGQPDRLTLWLPNGANELTPTDVPALRFPPAEAIDLLVACRGDACDDTVRFWGALAHYVMSRIAAQQFFPDVVRHDDGRARGVWRLLAGGPEDVERLERFAAAMPPAARAVVGGASDAAELVESFLSTAADAVIRRDVSHDPFFSRVHELAAAEDAPPEVRWMSALLGEDRTIHGDPYDTGSMVEQVRNWVGRLDETAGDAPWKLQFTLEEPDAEEDENGAAVGEPVWHVEIRLLPPEEDAAPVDVAELFGDRTEAGGIMGRKIAARRAQVMQDLAAAAEAFPPLNSALVSAAATGGAPAFV